MNHNLSKSVAVSFCIQFLSDNACNDTEVIKHLFEQGYRVKTGLFDFDTALASEFPNLFIVDIANPQIDQFKLIEKIRKSSPQVGILAAISLLNQDDRVKAFLSGADNYIIRPYEIEELLATLASLRRRLQWQLTLN